VLPYAVLTCADLCCALLCCAVVFGRVLEGLDVVDKLQNLAVDRSGRPGQKVVSVGATVLVGILLCAHSLSVGWL
jgi:cyclophilin family peptidyl-prolyl cis-trans isomerase